MLNLFTRLIRPWPAPRLSSGQRTVYYRRSMAAQGFASLFSLLFKGMFYATFYAAYLYWVMLVLSVALAALVVYGALAVLKPLVRKFVWPHVTSAATSIRSRIAH